TNAVQFKFDGGNGSTTAIYVDNLYFYKGETVGIDEFDRAEFNVFPNPTNNVWNIKSMQNIDLIQVFDIQGQLVITLTPNSETASINAVGLTNGIYFVKFNSVIGTKSVKLIKK
ncbi:MAG: T9SS type A sorting domain-containing protein, partial [Saprospiraceae bacterium]|nr:T9SS type A sorting domain-containing protein [Bacteroidia bacterium]NNL92657.1 T9SS type A sorting domain-containing protein [Saprospiraceae bacterium]